ncbi:hypothetical protein [Ancylobacter mangrovi]|uniref:hypothetical protein n=1 Tax=Ancylobacter mangrovi TaxID=2972472 RepID=UPI002163521D|nr:hypothetical protein [Ancylobacter mangrovi]MCS0501420.1 hypothetical protein [Ancylobacter mangrovi]
MAQTITGQGWLYHRGGGTTRAAYTIDLRQRDQRMRAAGVLHANMAAVSTLPLDSSMSLILECGRSVGLEVISTGPSGMRFDVEASDVGLLQLD